MKSYFVYILASRNKVLYVGSTDNISRRTYEHKLGLIDGFTKRYNVNRLVYYETHPDLKSAIKREKQLKNWHRQWKINLIESVNKDWKDLYSEISDPLRIIYE
ncbi:GIY-YIG nuclease superfamily protein [bacterium BMS3Abin03]|nr:GIY-YIG nuclease superfamily protein [bacterium BMS3Abin03]